MYTIFGSDNRAHGPADADVIRRWIAEGRANAETQVKGKGDATWRPLRSFPEFARDLPPGASIYGSVPMPASQSMAVTGPALMIGQLPAGPTNGLAVAGMIMGILSLLCICPFYGLPFNILGIVFSAVALGQLKRNPLQQGKGMAVAGLVMSIIGSIAILILIFLGVAAGFFGVFKG